MAIDPVISTPVVNHLTSQPAFRHLSICSTLEEAHYLFSLLCSLDLCRVIKIHCPTLAPWRHTMMTLEETLGLGSDPICRKTQQIRLHFQRVN